MSADDNTHVLLEKIQLGEQRALEELYERFALRIVSIVRSRLGAELRQKIESWDIVQDAMLDSLKQIKDFEYQGDGAFIKWWANVVENRIRQQHKYFHAQRRDVSREKSLNESSDQRSMALYTNRGGHSEDPPSPSRVFELNEDLLRLEQALDRLNSSTRELLIASQIEGRSPQEIGEALGKSPAAIRMQINRAKIKLAREFQKLDSPAENSDE